MVQCLCIRCTIYLTSVLEGHLGCAGNGSAGISKTCLCDQILETAVYLAFQCPYAKETWNEFSLQEPVLAQAAGSTDSILNWWSQIQLSLHWCNEKKSLLTATYVIWNIWNECNRRIFQEKKMSPTKVAGKIREELLQLKTVYRS